MSPYLHFGCISAQEILSRAREAGPAEQFGKFQDELVTWRELSHNFVFFNRKHRTVEGIPGWARDELEAHEGDPRPALYDDDTLEQARTGDALWNAAQRAYLRGRVDAQLPADALGEGGAGLDAERGRVPPILEHLNNKYALDGRDPNSYAGIHWTFGKFDRPFYRRPIYGTVRYQSLKTAKDKFDVPAYIARYAPSLGFRNTELHGAEQEPFVVSRPGIGILGHETTRHRELLFSVSSASPCESLLRFLRSDASWRSCTRRSSSSAEIAPTRARNMSHCVSQGSPWVPRNAVAASPVAAAAHHSISS